MGGPAQSLFEIELKKYNQMEQWQLYEYEVIYATSCTPFYDP